MINLRIASYKINPRIFILFLCPFLFFFNRCLNIIDACNRNILKIWTIQDACSYKTSGTFVINCLFQGKYLIIIITKFNDEKFLWLFTDVCSQCLFKIVSNILKKFSIIDSCFIKVKTNFSNLQRYFFINPSQNCLHHNRTIVNSNSKFIAYNIVSIRLIDHWLLSLLTWNM